MPALLQWDQATIPARRMTHSDSPDSHPSSDEPSRTELPTSDTLARALAVAGLPIDPSELHGSLCGYVAGGGRADAADWLQRLALDSDSASISEGMPVDRLSADAPAGDAIARLRAATLDQFAAQDFAFQLLLPSDDEPLPARAEALLGWCQGFLGGFGLAAPVSDGLSEDAVEALEDIGRIAASDPAYEGSEADEAALAEIVEFVRVAALLLHGECVQGAQRRQRLH